MKVGVFLVLLFCFIVVALPSPAGTEDRPVNIVDMIGKQIFHDQVVEYALAKHFNGQIAYMISLAMGLCGKERFYKEMEDVKKTEGLLTICRKIILKNAKKFSSENLLAIESILVETRKIHLKIYKKLKKTESAS